MENRLELLSPYMLLSSLSPFSSALLKYNLRACVELVEEENIEVPSWICFSSVDGENAPSGESFKECLDIINKSNKVHAVGINCAPPHFIETLIHKFKELTKKAIIVNPNSGEVWDGRAKRWLPSKCFGDDKFEVFATRWHNSGARLVEGCCRTTPSTILAISKEPLEGKIIVNSSSSISHYGVRLTVNGFVNLQIRGGSAGIIKSLYVVFKPISILNKITVVRPSRKIGSGTTECLIDCAEKLNLAIFMIGEIGGNEIGVVTGHWLW
ncbi:hypothetical protein SO802_013862 [Lithocarpus litseifolius]|uniref:Hcy-binding domain-containing protein n=1 Tax=Lithocarpus litseifolius TaxID=425828 RepID=A0AAW2DAX2_9ROSI